MNDAPAPASFNFMNWGKNGSSEPNIAFYCRKLASGGGAQRMICVLANALCKRDFTVYLITWDRPEARSFYPLDARVIWVRFGFRQGLRDKVRRTRMLVRLLRKKGIRIIVGFVMTSDKVVFTAAKLAGVRLIVAERNAPTMYRLFYGRTHRLLSFGMLYLADRITVQMPEFATGYPASLRDRIEVIPNPVPVAVRRAQPHRLDDEGRFTLLAVGRLKGPQKRLDLLVGAFARIAATYPLWHLRIIGDGPNKKMLERLANRGGLAERVHLDSWRSNIFDAYAKSHLYAAPSLWEGFPNALAEAMSHGLPAVGFRDAAGVAQLIADGETGWLADGLYDEVALAEALSSAMADDEERMRRGKLAAASMAAYAPEAQFDRWGALLGAVMAGVSPCVDH